MYSCSRAYSFWTRSGRGFVGGSLGGAAVCWPGVWARAVWAGLNIRSGCARPVARTQTRPRPRGPLWQSNCNELGSYQRIWSGERAALTQSQLYGHLTCFMMRLAPSESRPNHLEGPVQGGRRTRRVSGANYSISEMNLTKLPCKFQ